MVKARGFGAVAVALLAVGASAQTCTTQAKLVPGVREQLSSTALEIATAIKNGDSGAVGKLSVLELTQNFAATSYLVRTTGEAISGDTLRVAQLYQLDANNRAADDKSSADFSCPLTGSSSEVDFSIGGLPRGLYAFAMVEAVGEKPWVVAMLLRSDAGVWKMAGLYPHPRVAAGHDGGWYLTAARANAKAGKNMLAWLQFGLADKLLQPVGFALSTNLEKVRNEQTAAVPPELRDGLSADTPFVLKAADGTTFPVTALSAEGSEDGKRLNLVVRYKAESLVDPVALKARNTAAAKALVAGHPELKTAFDTVLVSSESAGQQPFPTQISAKEL